jgi:predicted DNA-binding transcriptional regulator AlpA
MQDSAAHIDSPLLTEKQTAVYVSRSLSSLRRDRKNGTGPGFVRLGRSVRYLRSELDRYIFASVARTEVDRG